MNFSEQSHELVDTTEEKTTAESAQQPFQDLIAFGTENLKNFQERAYNQSQQTLNATAKAMADWQEELAGLGTSGMVVANALKDLPRTAQALAEEMPKLARRLQTAGTRLGDAPRTNADVMGLFDKIPGPSKLGASEWDLRVFLSDKHGSHIHPHSKGGSNEAKNILWEVGTDNIRRGARNISGSEQLYIRFYNRPLQK